MESFKSLSGHCDFLLLGLTFFQEVSKRSWYFWEVLHVSNGSAVRFGESPNPKWLESFRDPVQSNVITANDESEVWNLLYSESTLFWICIELIFLQNAKNLFHVDEMLFIWSWKDQNILERWKHIFWWVLKKLGTSYYWMTTCET